MVDKLVEQVTLKPTFKGSYPGATEWEKIAENGSNKLLFVSTTSNYTNRPAVVGRQVGRSIDS